VFTIQTTIDCYLLPGDGAAAKQTFLDHLKDPHEMWIIAYSFTLIPMIDEILANNATGQPYHIYVDLSQSKGAAEKVQIQRLVDAGVEVTIGTSPAGTAYITHTKGVVCDDAPPFCWEGSVNFSLTGWMQVNTALTFHSQDYRDEFVKQFEMLRDYAWTNLRSVQLLKEPPKGVTIGPSTDSSAPATPTWGATGSAGKAKKTSTKKKSKTSKKGSGTSIKAASTKTPKWSSAKKKPNSKKSAAKKKGAKK
jgi:hypothetical protein